MESGKNQMKQKNYHPYRYYNLFLPGREDTPTREIENCMEDDDSLSGINLTAFHGRHYL